jgi:hypothetical protein
MKYSRLFRKLNDPVPYRKSLKPIQKALFLLGSLFFWIGPNQKEKNMRELIVAEFITLNGRPIAQWSRIMAGRDDDLGTPSH